MALLLFDFYGNNFKINNLKDLHNILQQIIQLTTIIETNYPELYRSLEENPMTLCVNKHPNMDKEVMQEYLGSLKQLLKYHLETLKIKL